MQRTSHERSGSLPLPLLVALCLPTAPAGAQEPVRLREELTAGYQYRVNARVELTARLAKPAEKGQKEATVNVTGATSALDYDERVLEVASDGTVARTVRFFRRVDFHRTVAGQEQKATIRPEVRRLVVVRHKNVEVPFCPEGPLTWDEIDVVRTDVFTPALTGLLPDRPVRPGDAWSASIAAVKELTDLEEIEEGKLDCKLEGLVTLEKRRHARVSFAGTLKGPGQDGSSRHTLEGYLYFDLESNHLSYLALKGAESLLRDGKEVGRVEGQFTLTRQAHTQARELADEAIKGLTLKENEENTLLLYDNADLGLRFTYPRRWRLAGGLGRQVRLDAKDGSGLQITLLPANRVPMAGALLAQERAISEKRQERIGRVSGPERLSGVLRGSLERFRLETEIDRRPLLLEFYVLRQEAGGAILSASLPAREAATGQREVERVARSLTLTRAVK